MSAPPHRCLAQAFVPRRYTLTGASSGDSSVSSCPRTDCSSTPRRSAATDDRGRKDRQAQAVSLKRFVGHRRVEFAVLGIVVAAAAAGVCAGFRDRGRPICRGVSWSLMILGLKSAGAARSRSAGTHARLTPAWLVHVGGQRDCREPGRGYPSHARFFRCQTAALSTSSALPRHRTRLTTCAGTQPKFRHVQHGSSARSDLDATAPNEQRRRRSDTLAAIVVR